MGDVEVLAEIDFAGAVSDAQILRGLDLEEALGVSAGVGAVGIVEQQVEVAEGTKHQLDVELRDFDYAVLALALHHQQQQHPNQIHSIITPPQQSHSQLHLYSQFKWATPM